MLLMAVESVYACAGESTYKDAGGYCFESETLMKSSRAARSFYATDELIVIWLQLFNGG